MGALRTRGMPKYSTGGSSGGSDGDACELCGETSDRLRQATVAGAELLVCPSCAPHDDTSSEDARTDRASDASDEDRSDESSGPGPFPRDGTSELWDRDSSRWEQEGTDYESDRLPYLVTDYGERVTDARQEAGFQLEELADELAVSEEDLLAVEQGRAARADVGGSTIEKLEVALDVTLVDET